jgi:hypothetical protein
MYIDRQRIDRWWIYAIPLFHSHRSANPVVSHGTNTGPRAFVVRPARDGRGLVIRSTPLQMYVTIVRDTFEGCGLADMPDQAWIA